MDVEIQMTGEWLRYNRKISEFQATQIMAFLSKPAGEEVGAQEAELALNPGQPSVAPASSAVTQPAHTSTPAHPFQSSNLTQPYQPVAGTGSAYTASPYESPRQAIAALEAKTNPQKIVAIALYLGATSENGKLVSNEDILAGFAKAAEKTPKNIARDIKLAVADGYIFQESSTTFRLLSVADQIAEAGFTKATARRRPAPKATDAAKRPKLPVRDVVLGLPVATSLVGYADFFDVQVRSDQILWIIKYAKGHGVDGINRQEIFHFSNKMGGDIGSKNFTASNTPNIKNGYISMEHDDMYLTAKGERYILENLAA